MIETIMVNTGRPSIRTNLVFDRKRFKEVSETLLAFINDNAILFEPEGREIAIHLHDVLFDYAGKVYNGLK